VPPATTVVQLGGRLRAVDRRLVLGERALVDHRADEVRQVGDVAHGERVDLGRELVLAAGVPDRARDVRAGGGRALLALVLEGAAVSAVFSTVRVGARVRDDEVLAAGLADQPRVGAVLLDVRADRLPQVLEGRGRAGEVDAGQVAVVSATSETSMPSPVTRLITPGGRPGLLEQPHEQCGASCCVGDGFHTTVLPISAGAVGRLPAIAVKLNGVIA
jgi:hypothetical protein